ncbi:MAG: DUF4890 domain-containing protein, partial [Prevotella sp.]|nr:DUF4890 domain-containing protein [Prevotella sp.]
MKKVVLTLVALLSLTAVFAQSDNKEQRAPRELTPQQRTDFLAKKLNLTDAQKSQLLVLNTEYADVLKGPGLRHGKHPRKPVDGESAASQQTQRPERPQMTDAQRDEMKKQFEKRKEYDEKVKKLLTEEQYKEYKKLQPRRHGHPGHHGKGPKG